jgi:hypothetical protein
MYEHRKDDPVERYAVGSGRRNDAHYQEEASGSMSCAVEPVRTSCYCADNVADIVEVAAIASAHRQRRGPHPFVRYAVGRNDGEGIEVVAENGNLLEIDHLQINNDGVSVLSPDQFAKLFFGARHEHCLKERVERGNKGFGNDAITLGDYYLERLHGPPFC